MADEATITLQIESASVTATAGDLTVKVHTSLSRLHNDSRGQIWRVQVDLPDASLKTEQSYKSTQHALDDAQAIARHTIAAAVRKAEAEDNLESLLDGWQHAAGPIEVDD